MIDKLQDTIKMMALRVRRMNGNFYHLTVSQCARTVTSSHKIYPKLCSAQRLPDKTCRFFFFFDWICIFCMHQTTLISVWPVDRLACTTDKHKWIIRFIYWCSFVCLFAIVLFGHFNDAVYSSSFIAFLPFELWSLCWFSHSQSCLPAIATNADSQVLTVANYARNILIAVCMWMHW